MTQTQLIQGFRAILQVDPDSQEGQDLVRRLAAGEPVPIDMYLNPNAPHPVAPAIVEGSVGVERGLWDERVVQCLMQRGLTEREAQVVVLDSQGWVRSGIAGEFKVSVRTVDWYWEEINAKLGTSKRPEVRELVKTIIAAL